MNRPYAVTLSAAKGLGIFLAHISILSCTSESSDRPGHQYSCGCERNDGAPEVSTQKRREVKAVVRHQMQCLGQYFLGKRSRYEPF